MSKLILDADLKARLNGLSEEVEVCDESGRTVGRFLPEAVFEDLLYTALAAEGPHSKEELKRRRHESGGRPLAEIWRSLGRT